MSQGRAENPRDDLLTMALAGLKAVEGHSATARYLKQHPVSGPIYPIAMGKAAASMMSGLLAVLAEQVVAGLVITKHGHGDAVIEANPRIDCVEASHPVPGVDSLAAGQTLLKFIAALPWDAQVIVLISGGTSSLVEVLRDGISLGDLARVNAWLLGNGVPIGSINRIRGALSRLKAGGLIGFLGGRSAQVLLISDVPDDNPATIGSGLLYRSETGGVVGLPEWMDRLIESVEVGVESKQGPHRGLRPEQTIAHHLIATNTQAKSAVAQAAQVLGYEVQMIDKVFENTTAKVADDVVSTLIRGRTGITVWGGESTVILPEQPGQGGRNQHLALQAAIRLAGQKDVLLLVLGTDGNDGPGDDAGALVDGFTRARGERSGLCALRCVDSADSGRFLAASGDLINTGPTGTNVMDLIIGLKLPRSS